MIAIKVICVGKLSTKHIRDLAKDYETRLNKYSKFSIIEVKESNKTDITEIVNDEGKSIMTKIDNNAYVYTLEIEGKQFSSKEFAKQINDLPIKGYSKINFIIGGSHGLSDEVKKRSNASLSFSKFTFPHALFRAILLEQIYRAFTIINNTPYHK